MSRYNNLISSLGKATVFCNNLGFGEQGSVLKNMPKSIFICPDNEQCSKMQNQLNALKRECVVLNDFDKLFTFSKFQSSEHKFDLIKAIYSLIKKDAIIISTPEILFSFIPNLQTFENNILNVNKNKEYDIIELEKQLISIGYKKVETLTKPGEFVRRGDILDIFNTISKNPIRLDFFDTQIEEMHFFDSLSFDKLESVISIDIVPNKLNFFSDSEKENILSNLSKLKIEDAGPFARKLLEDEYMEYFDGALEAIAEVGTAEDAQFLAEFINREDLSVAQQQSVMKALGRLKAVETWDALVEIAQNEDKNTFVRMYASEAIGAMEKSESVEVLASLFESSDPNLRASVIKGVSNFPSDDTARALIIEGIKDSHYKVRLESIAAVKTHSIKDAAAHIVFRAKNDPETAVKYACYEALGILGDQEGISYLQDLIKEKYVGDSIKVKASEALLAYGSSSATESVITLARESLADKKKLHLRYALGKLFASTENSDFADICREYLASTDVATVGTGLDIYERNRFSSVRQAVEDIANAEKNSSNKTKAKKILDRD